MTTCGVLIRAVLTVFNRRLKPPPDFTGQPWRDATGGSTHHVTCRFHFVCCAHTFPALSDRRRELDVIYPVPGIGTYGVHTTHIEYWGCHLNWSNSIKLIVKNTQCYYTTTGSGYCSLSSFPVLLMVGQSYVGNDVRHSTLLDTAYRFSNTAP